MRSNKAEIEPIHKYFRGKWKDLKYEDNVGIEITASEYKIKDLDQKSIIEIEELISRQEKILRNKAFLCKLEDKGEKLKEKYNYLKIVLENAKEKKKLLRKEDNSDYNQITDINSFEWTGNSKKLSVAGQKTGANEEEEENNPLQLLARHSLDYPLKDPSRYEEKDPVELIQEELAKLEIQDGLGVADSKTLSNSSSNYFGNRLLQIVNEQQSQKREPFKPNRSLRMKERDDVQPTSNSKGPPLKTVKLISLEESLKLIGDANQSEMVKVRSEAALALQSAKDAQHILPPDGYSNYRDANTQQHLLDDFAEDEGDYITTELTEEEGYD